MSVRNWLSIEYAFVFFSCLGIYLHLGYPFYLFLLLLFIPDITMVGYLISKKAGAILYNIGHTLALPFLAAASAYVFDLSNVMLLALVWIAHIGMDRAVGYGLKYKNDFKQTHLQRL